MKKYLIFLTLLLVIGCSKKKEDPLSQISEADISIPTAVCDMCVDNIKNATYNLEGVKGVDVDLEKKLVHIKYVAQQTNMATIEMAISDAGYDANDKKRNPDAYENLPECCKKE